MNLTTPTQQKAEDEKRRMKKAATRVNVHNPASFLPYKSDLAGANVRSKLQLVKPRDPSIVAPREVNIWSEGTYRTGDGDVVPQLRPGSMDAYALPSLGLGT